VVAATAAAACGPPDRKIGQSRPALERSIRSPAWSARTVADDPGAPFFNDTIKYVVSATLTTAPWKRCCPPDQCFGAVVQARASSM